jgi:hypothetical protein
MIDATLYICPFPGCYTQWRKPKAGILEPCCEKHGKRLIPAQKESGSQDTTELRGENFTSEIGKMKIKLHKKLDRLMPERLTELEKSLLSLLSEDPQVKAYQLFVDGEID